MFVCHQTLYSFLFFSAGIYFTHLSYSSSFTAKPARIWALVLQHTLLKKLKLVSFFMISASILLCSLQTHQVCTADAKIGTDATVIGNATRQCQVAAIKSSSHAHTVGPPIANERKCVGPQTGGVMPLQLCKALMCAYENTCMCLCEYARATCHFEPIPQLINSNKWLPPPLFCQWGCKPINGVISHHNVLPEHIMALVHGWEWLPLVA